MKKTATVQEYEAAFATECERLYPIVDEIERERGYALDRQRLLSAARVLACPVKVNPPNWQHGRVLYAIARSQLQPRTRPLLVDIGTAKGFSAIVMGWAASDAVVTAAEVISVDAVSPMARVPRNTVADVEGCQTVLELTEPFRSGYGRISYEFRDGGSMPLLRELIGRKAHVDLAFVDGKHSYDAVVNEGRALAALQVAGDVVVFDDLQIEGVGRAVRSLLDLYAIECIDIGVRVYGVAVRR